MRDKDRRKRICSRVAPSVLLLGDFFRTNEVGRWNINFRHDLSGRNVRPKINVPPTNLVGTEGITKLKRIFFEQWS